jgi:hypothetical protein
VFFSPQLFQACLLATSLTVCHNEINEMEKK